ncbi:MAG: Ldh family oxidoreductase [Eubacteriales bacterium]|nr:Ldh family oxidoreductase [Eubacteriales bacterium]
MGDYSFGETIRVSKEKVTDWSYKIYKKAGMSTENAAIVAKVQTAADLRGVYSHGVQRMWSYVKKLKSGDISASAQPEIKNDAMAFVMVEANNAMGQVAANYGANVAIERARTYGASTVLVRGSNHFGASAYYAMKAVKEDMIGICYTQGGANTMAPSGGKEPLIGNNPFSYAFPAYKYPPVVLDMALSVVAAGKLDLARITGSSIPDTWALDKNGIPTTDPNEFFLLQPMCGYKGYGLSFVTSLLCAALPDCPWAREQGDLLFGAGRPMEIGHVIQVINVGALMDVEAFKKRVDKGIADMKTSQKADGVSEIMVPGEPEARKEAEQTENGIEYPVELVDQLRDFSNQMGVKIPF